MHETRCNGTHNLGHERDTDATATRQRSNKEQRQPQANAVAVAVALVAHSHIKCVIDQYIDWLVGLGGCCERSLSQWQCGKMSPRGHEIEASLIVKGTRRSRTRARSESSTLPTHRPPIESSSSSRWLASSMMEHIDDDPRAM